MMSPTSHASFRRFGKKVEGVVKSQTQVSRLRRFESDVWGIRSSMTDPRRTKLAIDILWRFGPLKRWCQRFCYVPGFCS